MQENYRKIRYGMVGGGHGAFIGEIHRLAARLDNRLELVCGVFSRDESNSSAMGQALGLNPQRIYKNYEDMMQAEANLPHDERMEFVSIVTPNHVHFPVAKAAMEAGFHVLSDKPATKDFAEVKALQKIAKDTDRLFALTHTYLGYPLIAYARKLVEEDTLGDIRKVFVEYIQGWLSEDVNNKQASWRMDPNRSGASGCMADIGTHAHNLAEYVTGKPMTHVAADLNIFGQDRVIDDDGSALFKMEGGISGVLMASQICSGSENGLKIRVYGSKGGLSWSHEAPNQLMRYYNDCPKEIITSGQSYLPNDIQSLYRTPPGHPEGYIEAFANIYLEFAEAVTGNSPLSASIENAVRGMAFMEAVLESSQNGSAWTEISV